ncbi:hypothetical protein IAR55_006511 [Kwoniella newhampshirensis]|uniref:Reverse transcriptase domain-containing protein n=1 Tax=Kwoniella newhampshirensis TaxID=1651941 RepID=A0AAW0YTB9_9TREE
MSDFTPAVLPGNDNVGTPTSVTYTATAPPEHTSEEVSGKIFPPILRRPIAFKIHNLSSATADSALQEAEAILKSLPEIKAQAGGAETILDMKHFTVGLGNPTIGDRLNHSATVSFIPTLYKSEEDMPDERLLDCLKQAVQAAGFQTRWSAAVNNDRTTALKFDWQLIDPSKPLASPLTNDGVRDTMATLFWQLGAEITNVWEVRINDNGCEGFIGSADVDFCDKVVRESPFALQVNHEGRNQTADGDANITPANTTPANTTPVHSSPSDLTDIPIRVRISHHPDFIPVSSPTTLCLYISESVYGYDDYVVNANNIMSRIAKKFPNERCYAYGYAMSPCKRFFTFNASRPRHALEATLIPSINGYFYESAYIFNSTLNNFKLDRIRKMRNEKRIEWNKKLSKEGMEDNESNNMSRKRRDRATPFRQAFKRRAMDPAFKPQFRLAPDGSMPVKAPMPVIPPGNTSHHEQMDIDPEGPPPPPPHSEGPPAPPPQTPVGLPQDHGHPALPSAGSNSVPPTPTTAIGFNNLSVNEGSIGSASRPPAPPPDPSSSQPLALGKHALEGKASATGNVKARQIIDMISETAPVIFILTETLIYGGPQYGLHEALKHLYRFFTTPAGDTNTPGGITIGVHVQLPSRAIPVKDYQQNILHVEIQTPDYAGSHNMKVMDVFGVYSPQSSETVKFHKFWAKMEEVVATKTRWILAGDTNMILQEQESNAVGGIQDVRAGDHNAYSDFLRKTSATDLWLLHPDLSLDQDWTFGGPARPNAPQSRSIIDRIAVGSEVPAGHIETIQQTIDRTNHRAVFSRLPLPSLATVEWHNDPVQRRLIKPPRDSEKFEQLELRLNRSLDDDPRMLQAIEDDDTFDSVYEIVNELFTKTCEEVFERPKPLKVPGSGQIPTEERHLVHKIKLYNKSLAAIDASKWREFITKQTRRDRGILDPQKSHDLQELRRTLCKDRDKDQEALTNMRLQRKSVRDEETFKVKVNELLKTGTVRRIMPNQTMRLPPLILTDVEKREYTSEPRRYVKTIRAHFKNTVVREDPPSVDKPWLDSQASRRFRAETKRTPLEWPKLVTPEDVSRLLLRGNPTPAPGPEGWEKWALARSGTRFLGVITKLINYMITEDYFPSEVTENHIVPIYKRGDPADPNSYRGIVLANRLQVTVATWFTQVVQQYANKCGFIPDTQIAAKFGAQVSDMTLLLSSLDGYARVREKTWYALAADQKKGYDFMHQSGFADAVKFFGLPKSVLKFDKERTRRVAMSVKVRNQESKVFHTKGQTKQGDPFSPIKYVIVTAMLQWWLKEIHSDIGMRVQTPRHDRKGYSSAKHQRADDLSIMIQTLAATDDTFTLSESTEGLQKLAVKIDEFQQAYGMETNWEKTKLFMMGEPSPHQLQTTVQIHLPSGKMVHLMVQKQMEFLKTPINNPKVQTERVKDIIRNFTFPRPSRTLPMTAVRKIAQNLAGRILPKIQYCPIEPRSIEALQKMITVKVNKYLSLPYGISTQVLASPLEDGGLDFPNLTKLNTMWSLASLIRLLNSNNTTIATVMEIIHATFQCTGTNSHKCFIPLAKTQASERTVTKNPTPKRNMLVWEVSRIYLAELEMKILPSPLLNMTTTVPRLKWGDRAQPASLPWHLGRSDHSDLTSEKFGPLDELDSWIEAHYAMSRHRIQTIAGQPLMWATDGSMDPADSTEKRRTAVAVVGPLDFSIRFQDAFASIQEAEIAAVIIAIKLDNLIRRQKGLLDERPSIIYSDHLTTVRWCQDVTTMGYNPPAPKSPARQMLRWLGACLTTSLPIQFVHQKAHTDDQSPGAVLNRRADELAKSARDKSPQLRAPTLYMDTFALYTAEIGITHSYPPTIIQAIWEKKYARHLQQTTNETRFYDKWRFTQAFNSASVKTQAQIRSGQLPTPAKNATRENTEARNLARCKWCQTPPERVDERHIFVQCEGIKEILCQETETAVKMVQEYMANQDITVAAVIRAHVDLAKSILYDHELWEAGKSVYYVGALPKEFEYDLAHRPLYNKLSGLAIRVTARIWWDQVRSIYK